ncbi:MAG: hypothetical protein ACIAS6_00630 [Phycisphaerales bacterium JB060]
MSGTLPSGLPGVVGDDEDLARFLYASKLVRADGGVRPAAFMPNPKNGETSVMRHGPTPREALWALAPSRDTQTLHGAAMVRARVVRENDLRLDANDDPPRHANIVGWPMDGTDPQADKAECKRRALGLASASAFIPADPTH